MVRGFFVHGIRGVLFVAVMVAFFGCGKNSFWSGLKPQLKSEDIPRPSKVPEPINLLLPKEIRIHPFTGTRTFDEAGGIRGIDVRIEAIDHYGDTTKAFGDFRFELHNYLTNSANSKGNLMATWELSLMEPKDNLVHWDHITRTYVFKLGWDQPIPVGQRFVLTAVFSSPFTERLFAERVFVSGQ